MVKPTDFEGGAANEAVPAQPASIAVGHREPLRCAFARLDSCLRRNDGGGAGMTEGSAGTTEGSAGMTEGARE